MTEPSHAVFLSYASQDAPAAQRICEALRAAGIEVWFDQNELRGGDIWDQRIRQQVRDCRLFIAIISARTEARDEGYFRREWKLAVDRTHDMADEKAYLLPVVIDGTDERSASVPEKFRHVQWTRLQAAEVPASFVEHVKHLLAGERRSFAVAPAAVVDGAAVPARPAMWRRGLLLGAAAAVLLAGAGVAGYVFLNRSAAISMVAVLPFENTTGDPAREYLSDGISESLINRLSRLNSLHVISRTSAFAFKGKKLSAIDIGRQLGVDALLVGSLGVRGTDLAITAELVRVRDATQLWGEKYARPADDVQQVEGEIAATIAQNLRRRLDSQERSRLAQNSTVDPEAYRLYLRGRQFLVGNQQEMDKGIDYFQQAVERAPDYALAHAGLAEAYTVQAFLRGAERAQPLAKARTAVERALELDPDLAEAHVAQALVHFYFEWDWSGAEAEFRRALELNPGSEDVHEEYGVFLTAMGRLDEAQRHSSEAMRLDPLSVYPAHNIGIIAMVRGHFDEAAADFRRTIAIDPDWTWGYIKLSRALALQKKCPEAFAQAEVGERRIAGGAAPLSRSWLGMTYALCGDRQRAQQKLDELTALQKTRYVDPVNFAGVCAALGEIDEAVKWFERAYEDRTPNMVYANLPAVNPAVNADPRYKAIVARMGFPAPAAGLKTGS